MGNIAIVSCTSADLTPEEAKALGVTLVPLKVTFGDETWDTVTELSNEQFYEKLTAPGAPFPNTTAVNPSQFGVAFKDALDRGAEGVVCVTLSGDLSATYSSAVQAAGEFEPGVVEVIDSRTITQAQGIVVKRAADLAATGAGQAEIVDLAQDLIGRARLIFSLETLEYLQKGGRIGRANALIGSMLSIKPILSIEDGVVVSLDRKRTAAKARARMLEMAATQEVEEVGVVYTAGAADVEGFRASVSEACQVPLEQVAVGSLGAVAGTHGGPGLIGISRILAG